MGSSRDSQRLLRKSVRSGEISGVIPALLNKIAMANGGECFGLCVGWVEGNSSFQ